MSDEHRQTASALQAWASTVMSGGTGPDPEAVVEMARAQGQAQYDPADVISVFMSARESAKQRHAEARRQPPARRRGSNAQPS
jgi:hypothetical protein